MGETDDNVNFQIFQTNDLRKELPHGKNGEILQQDFFSHKKVILECHSKCSFFSWFATVDFLHLTL